MDLIKERFSDHVIRYGNMSLYFVKDAIDIIMYCSENKIGLRGLDAFILSGAGIQPSMENSIWFKPKKDEDYKKAIEFLSKRKNDRFVFELFYDGY